MVSQDYEYLFDNCSIISKLKNENVSVKRHVISDAVQNSTNNDDPVEDSSDNNLPQTEKLVATNHTTPDTPEEVTAKKTKVIPITTTPVTTTEITLTTKTTIKTTTTKPTNFTSTTPRSRITIVFKTTTPPPINGGKAPTTKITNKETTKLNTQSNANNITEIPINKDYIEVIDKEKNEDMEDRMMDDVDIMDTDAKKQVGVNNQSKNQIHIL